MYGLIRSVFLLALCATSAWPDEAGQDPRQAHGRFTGEIKPVLYVSDVEKSVPFYRDVLGFTFEGFAGPDGQPYYAEMVAGGAKFGLHEPTSKAQDANIGKERLYFRVSDLAAQRSRVLAWGVKPGEIKQTAWMDMFMVSDLDGNEIVFAVTDAGRHSIDPWNANAAGDDGRQMVQLPGKMQQHMLANMRDHLATINEILHKMADDEADQAADIAEARLGMSSLDDHGSAHMAPFMPEGMREAGNAMHRAASRFALKAQEGDALAAYAALAEVTSACVSCHAAYRIH